MLVYPPKRNDPRDPGWYFWKVELLNERFCCPDEMFFVTWANWLGWRTKQVQRGA